MTFDEANEDLSTDQKFEACRKDLRLVGLVASIDPDRDGVPESVIAARGAGIRVVMITGDYLKTPPGPARRASPELWPQLARCLQGLDSAHSQ